MKSVLFIPLALGLIATSSYAAPATPAKVLLAQNAASQNTPQIEQVKAGTLKTAQASWWGFDAADATQCLQDAINSGVPELIVDNTGNDWIIGKPLQLVSNQKIIFADGVVIQAKKGQFQETKDALFNGNKITNIALVGQGNAMLRMHRADYGNPKLYKKAEWRHGINLIDCKDVVIRGFTVRETGGDGLYLGATSSGVNQNVLVENMVFDSNYRQGVSVISADGLTIRNCKFNNTLGTAPQAGIDFEPNQKRQRLANCLIEDSEFINNKGSGVEIALMKLDASSLPISITVRRSRTRGNSAGLAVNPSGRDTQNPVKGQVVMEDCVFEGDRISLSNPVHDAIAYLFKNCTIDFSHQDNPDTKSWQRPIGVSSFNPAGGGAIGGIRFENVTVIGAVDTPISLPYQSKATISDAIGGNILLKQGERSVPYDLAGFVKAKQAEFEKFNQLIPATAELEKLQIPARGQKRSGNGSFFLRNEFTFLQYAREGEAIEISVKSKRIYPRKATIKLVDPSGKTVETFNIPNQSTTFPIRFTATQTGFYRLVRSGESSNYTDISSSHPGNGLFAENGDVQFLPTAGDLYFQVPAGVKEFAIGVGADTRADVALVDPSGKEVERQRELNSMHLFSVTRADESKSEIWSIRVRKAVWAVTVKPYAPLVPIVSTNPTTMLLK